MKTTITILIATIVALATSAADAYPGGFCTSNDGCARCEVCIADTPYGATGHCAKIAGCY